MTAPYSSPQHYGRFHDETWHTPKGRAIREVVFGMNDGLITTLCFLAGLSSAIAHERVILLAGLAEMVAGALSMALGAYLSTKAQREFFEQEIARERREIEEVPEHEREEVEEIYRDHGFTEEEVAIITRRITADKERWLRFMLREELGLAEETFDNPVESGAIMGVSFVIGSLPPLLPYLLLPASKALPLTIVLSILMLFGLGVGKTRVTKASWLRSGLEVVILGAVAAAVGYGLGEVASALLRTAAILP
jgi:predicted membrane protein (TIGR00267 family)